MMSPEAISAAKAHARAEYPKESCGLIVAGQYVPCKNVHEDPESHFRIDQVEWLRHGAVEMVVHSHPGGPLFPTEQDMVGQISTQVPWAIFGLDDERISDPIMWGDGLPRAPLVGRQFVHALADCYTTIRDAFALGKEGLAAEEVTTAWPYGPIFLPEVPRSDGWWDEGQDLYQDHFRSFGFEPITLREVAPGDIFFAKIRSDKMNHGGVMVDDDLLLHHLPGRLSRREPSGLWARHASLWVRYVGSDRS